MADRPAGKRFGDCEARAVAAPALRRRAANRFARRRVVRELEDALTGRARLALRTAAARACVLALAAVCSAPAAAQSEMTLVSNISVAGTDTVVLRVADSAIGFTTGANPEGYTLSSVELRLHTLDCAIASTSPAPQVRIASGSASTTAGQVQLSPPSNTLGCGEILNARYTAPEGTVVRASTTYWVVAEVPSGGTSWEFADSGTETGEAGWSISDSRQFRAFGSTGTFSTASGTQPLKISVNGTPLSRDIVHPRVLMDATLTLGQYYDGTVSSVRFGYADATATDHVAVTAGSLDDADFVYRGVSYTVTELVVSAGDNDGSEFHLGFQDADGNALPDDARVGIELESGAGDAFLVEWARIADNEDALGNAVDDWETTALGTKLPVRVLNLDAPDLFGPADLAVKSEDSALLHSIGLVILGYHSSLSGSLASTLSDTDFELEGVDYTVGMLAFGSESESDDWEGVALDTTPDLPSGLSHRLALPLKDDGTGIVSYLPLADGASRSFSGVGVDVDHTWERSSIGLAQDAVDDGDFDDSTRTVYLTAAPGETEDATPFWQARLLPGLLGGNTAGFAAPQVEWNHKDAGLGGVGHLSSFQTSFEGVTYSIRVLTFETGEDGAANLDYVALETRPGLPQDRGIGLEVEYAGRGSVVYWLGSEMGSVGNDRTRRYELDGIPHDHGWTSGDVRTVRLLAPGGTLPFQQLYADVSADGRTVTLTFSEALDGTSVPDPGEFDVSAGDRTFSVTSVDVSGSAVTLTLSDAVYPWDLVSVSLDSGGTPITSAGGDDADDVGGTGPPLVVNRSTVMVPVETDDYGTEDLVHARVLLDTTLTVGTYDDSGRDSPGNELLNWRAWGYRAAEGMEAAEGALADDSFVYRGVEYTITELAVTGASATDRPSSLGVSLEDEDGNDVADAGLAFSIELADAQGGTRPVGWGHYRDVQEDGDDDDKSSLAEAFAWNVLSDGHKLPVRILRDGAPDVYGPAKLSFEANEEDTAGLGQFIGFNDDQDPTDVDAKLTGALDRTDFRLEGVDYSVKVLGFLSPDGETGDDSVVLSTDPDLAADDGYRLFLPRPPDVTTPSATLLEWTYLSLADGKGSGLTDGYTHYDHIWEVPGFLNEHSTDISFSGDFYDTSRSVYITRAPGETGSATAFWEAELTPEVTTDDQNVVGFVASGATLSEEDGPVGTLSATQATLDGVEYTVNALAFETDGNDHSTISILTTPGLPPGRGIGLEVEYDGRDPIVYWVGVDMTSLEDDDALFRATDIPDDHDWDDSTDVRAVRLLAPGGTLAFGAAVVAVSADGKVTLTFSEELDGTSEPAPGDFKVRLNGRPVAVSSVALSGMTATLTLATTVTPRHGVEVDYAPGTNPLRSAGGEDADAFSGRMARNDLTGTALDTSTYGTQDMVHPRVLLDTTLTVGTYTGSNSRFNWETWGYRAADGVQAAEGAMGDDSFVFQGVEYTIVELAVTAGGSTDLPQGLVVTLQDADGTVVTDDSLDITVELTDALGGTVAMHWEHYRDLWDNLRDERYDITERFAWNLLSDGHTLPVRILARYSTDVWIPHQIFDDSFVGGRWTLGTWTDTGAGGEAAGYGSPAVGSLDRTMFEFDGTDYTVDRLSFHSDADGVRLQLSTTPDLPNDGGLGLVADRRLGCGDTLAVHYPVAAVHADSASGVDYGWRWEGRTGYPLYATGQMCVHLTRAPGDTRGEVDPFWAATLTPGQVQRDGSSDIRVAGFLAAGSTPTFHSEVSGPLGTLSSTELTLDGVTYTVNQVAFQTLGSDSTDLDYLSLFTSPERLPYNSGIGLEVDYEGRSPVVYWIGTEIHAGFGTNEYAVDDVPTDHGWGSSTNPRLVRLVTNDLDETAPAVVSAEVEERTLVLTYDDALDEGSVPAATDYTVTVAGSGVAVTGVSVSGTTAVLTLASAAAFGETAAVTYAPGTNRLRDTAGNEAAALSGESVTVIDETAPTLLSATVEGTALKLVYDEALKATPAPVASDFTVTVAGSARTVTGVAISGATVTLTLSSAVSSGETVTLDYTAGTNPIQDASGNQAADLSGQAVDEADTTPPTLSTATVEGTSLILTYNEALDATSEPAASDFTVTVAGSARTVSGVAVSGMTVTLTLGSAVTAGQAVTLDYTAGTNPIQDTSGNDAAGLSAQTVTIVDTMAPVIRGATVEGTTLILTYSEALDGTSTPVASDFTVTVDGSARTVSSVAISGATVTLTLASAVTPGQAVTVAYTSGTNPIEDAAGNDAADLTARAADEVDTTPPTLSTATVEGTTLILTYNEVLDGNSTPAASDFTVTVNGSARSVSGVALSGTAVTLTLGSAVTAGQTVTVSYTAAANPIQDAEGNDAAGLSNQAVTIVDTTAPVLRFATVEGTTLILTYGEALKAAPLPATGDFTVTVAGSSRSVSSVAISGATVTLTLSSAVTAGQAVTVSYTAGTNPIQDAAGQRGGGPDEPVRGRGGHHGANAIERDGGAHDADADLQRGAVAVAGACGHRLLGGLGRQRAHGVGRGGGGLGGDADAVPAGAAGRDGDGLLHGGREPDRGRAGQRRGQPVERGGHQQHGRAAPGPADQPDRQRRGSDAHLAELARAGGRRRVRDHRLPDRAVRGRQRPVGGTGGGHRRCGHRPRGRDGAERGNDPALPRLGREFGGVRQPVEPGERHDADVGRPRAWRRRRRWRRRIGERPAEGVGGHRGRIAARGQVAGDRPLGALLRPGRRSAEVRGGVVGRGGGRGRAGRRGADGARRRAWRRDGHGDGDGPGRTVGLAVVRCDGVRGRDAGAHLAPAACLRPAAPGVRAGCQPLRRRRRGEHRRHR